MRAGRFILSLLILPLAAAILAPSGCRSRSPETESAGIRSKVTDPDTRVVLTAAVDRTSMGIADRLLVHVTLGWEVPASVELVEPDWAQSDWTLIESTRTPIETRGGRYHQERTYLLEPFLAGMYQVPSFSVSVLPEPGADESVTISTEPLALAVESVLAEGDSGTLNPVGQTLAPPPGQSEQATGRALIFAAVAAVLVCCVAVVLALTRSDRARGKGPSIHDRLVKITRQGEAEQDQAYAQLREVFSLLDPRLRQTSEISRLMSICERAQYAPDPGDAPSPAVLARHTLELLGSTGEDAA